MGDSYTVLARRYRSQTFDQLVGQEAIAQTLKNALKTSRVAHAFLFTGTRGVGKTSAARILAKAINCPQRNAEGNPCGTCNSCQAIARGEDLDVIEIDGASNNGVENIRDLRQAAGVRPARSPFKIYIIDEVHMVTTQAFNALLKTLEEPPPHVKFIFATTEVNKVPPTILSRCQRFDFKNIATSRIADHLRAIVNDEGVSAEEAAILRIARLGNGSMRDALSILDRVLSLGEKQITDKVLEELLGKPPTAAIGLLVTAIANGDAAEAMRRADALLKDGMGIEQVLEEILDFLRNMMLIATCGIDTSLLEVPAESRPMYAQLAARYDPPTLVHLMALCEQTLRSLKGSTMPRPLFDALIVRLALAEQFSAIRDLLAAAPPAPPSAPQTAGQKKNDTGPVEVSPAEADRTPAEPPPAPAPPAGQPPPDDPDESQPEESIYQVMKQHMARQKEELAARNAAWRNGRTGRPGAVAQTPPRQAPAPPVERATDLGDLADVWRAARVYLTHHARMLENVLGGCSRVAALDAANRQVVLEIPSNHQRFTNDKARARLEEALRAVTGMPLKLRVEFVEQTAPPEGMAGTIGVTGIMPAMQRIPPELLEKVQLQPVVRELMKRLDATVTHVEILESPASEPPAE